MRNVVLINYQRIRIYAQIKSILYPRTPLMWPNGCQRGTNTLHMYSKSALKCKQRLSQNQIQNEFCQQHQISMSALASDIRRLESGDSRESSESWVRFSVMDGVVDVGETSSIEFLSRLLLMDINRYAAFAIDATPFMLTER
jgi:hypothetical protein